MARSNKQERKMVKLLDDLREFESFRNEILPKLQKMLKEGASAQKIYEFAQSYAAARAVSVLMDPDSTKALAAAKDILDRTIGKPKERHEHEHKYSQLKDEELDALLTSRLKEVEELEEPKH